MNVQMFCMDFLSAIKYIFSIYLKNIILLNKRHMFLCKEGRSLLAGEKLADTRQETKRKSKGSLKRATTIDAVVAEGEILFFLKKNSLFINNNHIQIKKDFYA